MQGAGPVDFMPFRTPRDCLSPFAPAQRRYTHLFLCAPDFPFVQDGTRRGDDVRQAQHPAYLQARDAHAMPFVELRGTLRQPVVQVLAVLETATAE